MENTEGKPLSSPGSAVIVEVPGGRHFVVVDSLKRNSGPPLANDHTPLRVAVITGDLIASRLYSRPQRQEVNQLLEQAFTAAAGIFPQTVYAPLSFSVVQGDEFQLVLEEPANAYPFVVFMRNFLGTAPFKPVPSFRAAIGIGEMAIAEGIHSYAMDGTAFHRSRDGINVLTSEKTGRKRLTTLKTGDAHQDEWFDLLLMYQDFLESRWTVAQREAVRWRQEPSSTYGTIGNKLGVAQQNVQKRLRAAHWEEFHRGMDFIRKAFSPVAG